MSRVRLPALLALCVGCSDAQYATPAADAAVEAQANQSPDGRVAEAGIGPSGSRDATLADAGPALADAGAWYEALQTQYAISTRFFSKDRGLPEALFSHEIIQLARVTVEDGKVQMETVRCRDHGNAIALGVRGEFEWAFPAKLPPQQFELLMSPDGIRTEAPPRPIGFTLEQPAGCAEGKQLAVSGRKWLADGKCDCRYEALPVVASDCRVVDADGDGNQAITLVHAGTITDHEYTRMLDRTQIVEGQLKAGGRIEARFIENYDTLILTCDGVCGQRTISACPLPLNRVLFEPLADRPEGWTCESVMAEVNALRLFPMPVLNFIDGC